MGFDQQQSSCEVHESSIGEGAYLPEPAERVCDTIVAGARRHGDRLAVICGDDRLTYRELVRRSHRHRGELLARSASERVGLYARRTADTLAWLLAIHLSGRSFVFLDPDLPEPVQQHIRTSAGIDVIIDPGVPGAPDFGEGRLGFLPAGGLDDEAYVLYTSGSTGNPKGVSVTQRNLASSNLARLEVYRTFGPPTFLLLSPFAFDSSIAGVWGTLAAGGTLVVAKEDERRDPQAVGTLVVRHRVTQTLTVPSFYAEFVQTVQADCELVEAADSLGVVVCAGESLSQNVLQQHFATFGNVCLINEYGPTECSVWSTYKRYDRVEAATIGGPIPGTSIHLLDDTLSEVPFGESGQIVITGPGVATGYVGDAAETDRKFVELALGSGETRRAYLTGDLGRWSDAGELEFLGRIDNQVKIRGFRINLDTIEQALATDPAVLAAAVAYDAESATCYAFVVKHEQAELDPAGVRGIVEGSLGKNYVPDRVVFTASLPRTTRDKIDRQALLEAARREPAAAQAAGDDLTSRITRAWEKVLGVAIGAEDERLSFFDLGGNSLSILKLSRALGEIAGKPVSVGKVYRCGTIEQQAALLRTLTGAE